MTDLTNLSKLWQDTELAGRRAIAEAAFDRIEAMGLDLVIPTRVPRLKGMGVQLHSAPIHLSAR